jgi:hypothetical protein
VYVWTVEHLLCTAATCGDRYGQIKETETDHTARDRQLPAAAGHRHLAGQVRSVLRTGLLSVGWANNDRPTVGPLLLPWPTVAVRASTCEV